MSSRDLESFIVISFGFFLHISCSSPLPFSISTDPWSFIVYIHPWFLCPSTYFFSYIYGFGEWFRRLNYPAFSVFWFPSCVSLRLLGSPLPPSFLFFSFSLHISFSSSFLFIVEATFVDNPQRSSAFGVEYLCFFFFLRGEWVWEGELKGGRFFLSGGGCIQYAPLCVFN